MSDNGTEQDLTGEVCPECHEGHLYPAGHGPDGIKDPIPISGEQRSGWSDYECDRCGFRTKAHGVAVGVGVGMSAHVKLKNPDDEDQGIPDTG